MVKLKLVSDHAKEQAIKEEQAEATQNLTLATNHLVEYGFFYFHLPIYAMDLRINSFKTSVSKFAIPCFFSNAYSSFFLLITNLRSLLFIVA